MKKPVNLRVENDPYPHLRDDEGCVLARDHQSKDKLAFIIAAVNSTPSHEAVAEPINYDALANGDDKVLRDLAVIVMSEQTGSRWMMAAAEAAIVEIIKLRAAAVHK